MYAFVAYFDWLDFYIIPQLHFTPKNCEGIRWSIYIAYQGWFGDDDDDEEGWNFFCVRPQGKMDRKIPENNTSCWDDDDGRT